VVSIADEVITASERPIPPVEFAVRSFWIAVRLVLVYYLGQQGILFFYQVF
jgi:hypothetical protein